jgi:hypothetical protein
MILDVFHWLVFSLIIFRQCQVATDPAARARTEG